MFDLLIFTYGADYDHLTSGLFRPHRKYFNSVLTWLNHSLAFHHKTFHSIFAEYMEIMTPNVLASRRPNILKSFSD